MQPKFTLKRLGTFFKTAPMLLILFCITATKINAQCSWTAAAVYPIPVLDQATVTLGTTLYSFSGVSNGAIVGNSYKFDGTVWTPIAAPPQALEFPAAVTDGTNIYVLGGASTVGTPQTTLYRYNVAANNYTTLASFSVGTWNQTAIFLGGKIYKFCGTGAAGSVNNLEIYDIAANTWSAGAPYPLAMSFVGAYTAGGFIYAAGGISAAATNKAYRYDPVANTWDDPAMADLPVDRWGTGFGGYNGGFVMAGGYVSGAISNTVVQWDQPSNSWSTLPNMLGDRARMTGAVLNNNLYVIGGRSTAVGGFTGTNNNQQLNCIPLTPCTGTPAPGNTNSSANPVCPGINFTVSLQNNPPVSGLTYQWQSSTTGVGGPFSTIAGATGATYTTNIAVATAYRCIVTCGANSATSNPVNVTINPPSSCYCTAGAVDLIDEKISNVTFGSINNNSSSQAGYEDFTSISTNVIKGQTLPISISVSNFFGGDQGRVWIDFNQNGNFTDPGEQVFTSPANGPAPLVGNLTVPVTANTGSTRMRVRLYWAPTDPNPGPCGNTVYGQVEDYTINIQPCINTAFTSQPANATTQCSSNATFTVGATGSIITYGWETRTNASAPWQNVLNGGVYSGATTATLTLTGVPSSMNGYQYRAITSNPCTAFDFSSVATLTVNPLVANVTPSSATICTGSIQQLSITNITASPTTSVFSSGAINIPIPDANLTGINHTIPVSGISGVITDVSVRFSVPAHTWPGDLAVVVKSPSGQVLSLDYFITGTGAGPGAGMVNTNISSNGTAKLNTSSAPYTGTFAPDGNTVAGAFGPIGPTGYQTPAVATFGGLVNFANGTTANGNWTIAIYDGFGGDIGSLTNWQVSITYVAPVFATGIWSSVPAAPPTIFTDAAATVAYTGTPVSTVWVKPTVNTNYSVVVTIGGCVSGPTIVPVTVVNPVTALVNPINKSVCVGGSTTFSVSATGGPFTYQWQQSTDGGVTWTNIAGATSATLNVNGVTQSMNNNRYRALVSAPPCAGTTTSAAAILTVNALPVVTISSTDVSLAPGQTTTITGSSTPAAAAGGWTWTLNGAGIAGTGNTQTANVDQMGTYHARVVDINGCVGNSNDLVIGAEASDRLWIYPNPNSGQFQVRLYYESDVAEKRTVTIYNQLGQVIQSKAFELGTAVAPYLQMNFNLGHVARGIYVVKVAHQYTGKVISGLVIID